MISADAMPDAAPTRLHRQARVHVSIPSAVGYHRCRLSVGMHSLSLFQLDFVV